jgi:hypothetical protein
MFTHKHTVRLARNLRTPLAMRKRIPLFQTKAWERSNVVIAMRVSKQGKGSLS